LNNHDTLRAALALADLAAKSTLILLGAWLFTLMLRKGSAAARHLVWLTSFCVLLLLPFVSLLMPAHRIAVIREAAPPVTAKAVSPSLSEQEINLLLKSMPKSPGKTSQIAPQPESLATRQPDLTNSVFDWHGASMVLLAIWSAGVAGSFCYSLFGLWAVGSLKNKTGVSTLADSTRVDRSALSRQVGLTRSWDLCVSSNSKPPAAMTWGLIRPVVLLPQDSVTWSQERLEAVLLHELAHVRRRDSLSQLIVVAASALYWFNPAVWLCARAMRAEAEQAADDAVIRMGVKPSDYARELLQIAAELGRRRQPFTHIGVPVMKQSKIESRVKAILDPTARRRRGVTGIEVLAIVGVAAVAIFPLSSIRAAIVRDPGTSANVPVEPSFDRFSSSLKSAAIKASTSHAKHTTAAAVHVARTTKPESVTTAGDSGALPEVDPVAEASPSEPTDQDQASSSSQGSTSSSTGSTSTSSSTGSAVSTGSSASTFVSSQSTGSAAASSSATFTSRKRDDGSFTETMAYDGGRITRYWKAGQTPDEKKRRELLLADAQGSLKMSQQRLEAARKMLKEQRRALLAIEKKQIAILTKVKLDAHTKKQLAELQKAEENLLDAKRMALWQQSSSAWMESSDAKLQLKLAQEQMEKLRAQQDMAAQNAASKQLTQALKVRMEQLSKQLEDAEHQKNVSRETDDMLRKIRTEGMIKDSKIKLADLMKQYERLAKLYEQGFTSHEDLDEARARVERARADFESTKAILDQLNADGSIKKHPVPPVSTGSAPPKGG